MGLFSEREKAFPIEERPETPSPLNIERKEVVTPIPSQFTAQVTDDKGQNIVSSPATKTVTIRVPTDQGTLVSVSKGSAEESKTWWGAYWLRMIKKALHFGWQIITGGKR